MTIRSYSDIDEATTASYGPTQLSGVHETPTQPAPYVEDGGALIGSIPRDSLAVRFVPVVALRTGQTAGFEALPHCSTADLADPEELFARAAFEQNVGELGRTLRGLSLGECAGADVFLSVHPHELKEAWLIRPDDPLSGHDAEVYLQLAEPAYTAVCNQVLREVAGRTGVSVVLDDFGGDGTTILQLVQLAPAFVRLGVPLARELDRNPRAQKAVTAVVRMCADLGAQVIAKGVQTAAELHALVDCGVSHAQGAVFGAPAPVPTVATLRW